MLRVLIVDDHWLVRDGLREALGRVGDIEVLGEATSLEELLAFSTTGAAAGSEPSTAGPDVILLDAMLGDESSLSSIPLIKQRFPAARVLVVSMLPENPYAVRAIEEGADGYVSKGGSPRELVDAIRVLADGQSFLSPHAALLLTDHRLQRNVLTPREVEIVQHYALGLRCGQIAELLSLSPKTVSTHKANAMQKLGIHTSADLIRWAIDRGLA